jgi:monolysocardiolipin acyltransferase
LGKALLLGLNTTTVDSPGGAEKLRRLVMERDGLVVGAAQEEAGGGSAATAAAATAPPPPPPPPTQTTPTRRRPGLLTYSNHTSTFDDPGVLVALLPLSLFWTEHAHGLVRWTLCAREICFKNAALSAFFRSGKAFPVERGGGGGGGSRGGNGGNGGGSGSSSDGGGNDGESSNGGSSSSSSNTSAGGLEQPAMVAAAHALGARGDWVHLFPEGRVYDFRKAAAEAAAAATERESGAGGGGAGGRRGGDGPPASSSSSPAPPPPLGPFRQGAGKLVCDARRAAGGHDPIVVPLAHSGMQKVLPRGGRVPRAGQRVRVAVGEPLDLSPWTCLCEHADAGERERAWRGIVGAMRAAMSDLQRTIE